MRLDVVGVDKTGDWMRTKRRPEQYFVYVATDRMIKIDECFPFSSNEIN